MEQWEVKGGVLEYIDETHTYLYDGIVLPSITQILKAKFGGKNITDLNHCFTEEAGIQH